MYKRKLKRNPVNARQEVNNYRAPTDADIDIVCKMSIKDVEKKLRLIDIDPNRPFPEKIRQKISANGDSLPNWPVKDSSKPAAAPRVLQKKSSYLLLWVMSLMVLTFSFSAHFFPLLDVYLLAAALSVCTTLIVLLASIIYTDVEFSGAFGIKLPRIARGVGLTFIAIGLTSIAGLIYFNGKSSDSSRRSKHAVVIADRSYLTQAELQTYMQRFFNQPYDTVTVFATGDESNAYDLVPLGSHEFRPSSLSVFQQEELRRRQEFLAGLEDRYSRLPDTRASTIFRALLNVIESERQNGNQASVRTIYVLTDEEAVTSLLRGDLETQNSNTDDRSRPIDNEGINITFEVTLRIADSGRGSAGDRGRGSAGDRGRGSVRDRGRGSVRDRGLPVSDYGRSRIDSGEQRAAQVRRTLQAVFTRPDLVDFEFSIN